MKATYTTTDGNGVIWANINNIEYGLATDGTLMEYDGVDCVVCDCVDTESVAERESIKLIIKEL